MRVGILTSGGDAPGMNAAIRACVRALIQKGADCYGIYQGYEGLLHEEIEHFSKSSVADIIQRGGTMLRTARSKEFMTVEGRKKAKDVLDKYGIESLIVIGGDGTMHGALSLSEENDIKVYALPGTIDNDLAYTDLTIGFDTAVNTALYAISNIRDTSTAMGRTTILEVMGRHCGDIALYAGLAGGAEKILVPEEDYDLDAIADDILSGVKRGKKHSIIVKAEGVKQSTEEICRILEEKTGAETKSVLLGYIQRGGSPTANDRILASRLGVKAAELAIEKAESSAVGIKGDEVIYMGLREALEMPKKHHLEFNEICKVLL